MNVATIFSLIHKKANKCIYLKRPVPLSQVMLYSCFLICNLSYKCQCAFELIVLSSFQDLHWDIFPLKSTGLLILVVEVSICGA